MKTKTSRKRRNGGREENQLTTLPVHNKYKNIHAPWRTRKRGSQSSTSISSIGGGSPGSAAHLYR